MDLRELPAQGFTRHPWEKARVKFFARILEKEFRESSREVTVLDVGGGDGYFAQSMRAQLHRPGDGVCWDVNYSDEFIASGKDMPFVFTRERPKEKFDLLLLMDVLEHVENDEEFLAGLVQQNLNEGGVVLLSVPAWQILFSNHDYQLQHHRRYSPKTCLDVMSRSGLSITFSGGLFHSLLLPRILQRIKETVTRADIGTSLPNLGNWNHGKYFTFLVDCALALDNFVSYVMYRSRIQLPGLSYWAIARKS